MIKYLFTSLSKFLGNISQNNCKLHLSLHFLCDQIKANIKVSRCHKQYSLIYFIKSKGLNSLFQKWFENTEIYISRLSSVKLSKSLS